MDLVAFLDLLLLDLVVARLDLLLLDLVARLDLLLRGLEHFLDLLLLDLVRRDGGGRFAEGLEVVNLAFQWRSQFFMSCRVDVALRSTSLRLSLSRGMATQAGVRSV